jgi:predicted nucleic acid-binding protein
VSANRPAYILDSFAILAYFEHEPGGERVRDLLVEASKERIQLLLPLVNLGEVAYITERERGLEKTQQMLAVMQQTSIQVLPADYARVMTAAHIKANYPISYADAFVAGAAVEFTATVLTGDGEFQRLSEVVNVEWIES